MRGLNGENNEPQMNADERRCILTTDYIKTTHRKGRKERKEKRQESLHPLRPALQKYCLSELRTRMTRIRRIFTDTANPCVSVSSVQSVFYGDCPHAAPNTKTSVPIGMPSLLLNDRAKDGCGVVANKEPQMNVDERRCILTTDYIKTTHRKGHKELKAIQQELLRSGMENRYSINNELVRTRTNSSYQEIVRVRISSLLMSILSFSLRPLRSLRLDVFSTLERAIRALHGVSAFICVHLRLILIKAVGGI